MFLENVYCDRSIIGLDKSYLYLIVWFNKA